MHLRYAPLRRGCVIGPNQHAWQACADLTSLVAQPYNIVLSISGLIEIGLYTYEFTLRAAVFVAAGPDTDTIRWGNNKE